MPELSVVIPSMNEEEGIRMGLGKIGRVFAEHNIDGEIVVSDNSTDDTPKIAQSLGARVVTPDRTGYGHAIAYAIDRAKGRYILMADADGSYDFDDIARFLEPLRRGEADVVIGNRFSGGMRRGAMPWLHRRIGNPLLTWALNRLLGTRVCDAHCGMRSFTREVWDHMNLELIPQDLCSEMLRGIARDGFRVQEVPIAYYPRIGEPKAGTLLHGWRCFSFLIFRILLRR